MARALADLLPPADLTVAVVRALRSALHGFVSLDAGGGFGQPVDVDRSFDLLIDLLVAGVPALAPERCW